MNLSLEESRIVIRVLDAFEWDNSLNAETTETVRNVRDKIVIHITSLGGNVGISHTARPVG